MAATVGRRGDNLPPARNVTIPHDLLQISAALARHFNGLEALRQDERGAFQEDEEVSQELEHPRRRK
jgi:hypothetical protein